MADAGEDGEKEMRFRGVRKRKWGKYVAEIRSGKRSRISLGSYFTPHAAARAYDTALLCLRGPNATCFNFPDSQFNLEVANVERNPSPQAIRTAAIAVGSACDVVPGRYFRDNNNQTFEKAAHEEQPAQGGETINDQRNRPVEEKMAEEQQVIYESTDAESFVQSAGHTLSDQSIQTTFNFMI
ncbi:hypothetical protein SUGI_0297370 [Cryptomeria japonica]|uniref:ethylene-responsive transcription factor ERF011 n=1 Tax=Cryptomeria japonica TaxID=3369 RepID=UPI002408C901|nr:ethylene-responsive transcription factor ERF011 [Cryptomeria japonica]GLJ17174.1 hypothetical protein SUGI_0297370 [Cryptomeria japonica]